MLAHIEFIWIYYKTQGNILQLRNSASSLNTVFHKYYLKIFLLNMINWFHTEIAFPFLWNNPPTTPDNLISFEERGFYWLRWPLLFLYTYLCTCISLISYVENTVLFNVVHEYIVRTESLKLCDYIPEYTDRFSQLLHNTNVVATRLSLFPHRYVSV